MKPSYCLPTLIFTHACLFSLLINAENLFDLYFPPSSNPFLQISSRGRPFQTGNGFRRPAQQLTRRPVGAGFRRPHRPALQFAQPSFTMEAQEAAASSNDFAAAGEHFEFPAANRPNTPCAQQVATEAQTGTRAGTDNTYRVVCYFPQYAIYRPGVSKITPDQFDPQLCTHIFYAFTKPNASYQLVTFDDYADVTLGGFNKIVGLKQQNPNLKVLASVGGYSAGSQIFSELAQTNASRAAFIKSAIAFLKMWNFDGLDIDWEFPTWEGGKPQDRQNFPIWLAEMRAAFDKASVGGNRYLLTFSASASSLVIDQAFDFPRIMPSVDFVTCMAYDFHFPNEPLVDHHAPLYSYPGEAQPTFNADWAVKKFLSSGVPASKLVLGMPLYGRAWTLANPTKNTILSPGAGPAQAGPYLQTAGFLGYLEICLNIKNNGWVKSSGLNRTYATGQGQWVGFDAPEDGTRKANYVVQNGLGGIMFWELSYEDFNNFCGGGKYPVVNAVKTVFAQAAGTTTSTTSSPTTPTTTPTTTSTSTTTQTSTTSTTSRRPTTSSTTTTTSMPMTTSSTASPSPTTTTAGSLTTFSTTATPPSTTSAQNSLVCYKEGFWTDPRYPDCSRFIRCINPFPGSPLWIFMYACSPGTVFDTTLAVCNFASAVTCTFDSTAVQII